MSACRSGIVSTRLTGPLPAVAATVSVGSSNKPAIRILGSNMISPDRRRLHRSTGSLKQNYQLREGKLSTIRSRSIQAPQPAAPVGIFRAKSSETVVFETCNKFYFNLDIYSSAPIKDMGRRRRSAVDSCCKFRRLEHAWNSSPMGP